MLRSFFGKKEEDQPKEQPPREKQIVIEGQEEQVEETISLLSKEGEGILDEAMEEVETAVKEAAKTSLKDLRLMEEGRCPDCGRKLNHFLFTSVCSHCGWFAPITANEGRTIVHMKDGSTFECGTTFDTKGGYILCITDEVVRAKIDKNNVNYEEFVWSEEEIARRRNRQTEAAGRAENGRSAADPET